MLVFMGADSCEPWYESGDFGHEVDDQLWAEYQAALDKVDEIEQRMENEPFVDHRPPLTYKQRRFIEVMMPNLNNWDAPIPWLKATK